MKSLRQKVLNSINIVDEIQNYLDVEKSGQNYKCICPFHNDTDPSLTISEEKQIFKCFVCGEGGTAIEFIEKFEKISQKEALKKLANKVGIKVDADVKREEFLILEQINLFYNKILINSEQGSEARKYLEDTRKIPENIINDFQIGYSPKFSTVLYDYISEYMVKSKLSFFKLEKLKVFSEKNYDLLNGRITFPIYDEYDRVVGFSGRTLDGNIKYLNSKQTDIFNKGKILYNLNNIIKNKEDNIVIVEGFFDVVTAHKNGITNAVATMGIAFTQLHIKLLNKYKIKKIYLGFDSDDAGKKTTNQTAKELIENGFDVKVITYGDSKDIDEYLNNNIVTEDFIKATSKDYLLYLLNEENTDNLTLDIKSKLINKVCGILKYYKNDSKKDLLIEEIANILEVNKDIIIRQVPQSVNARAEQSIKNNVIAKKDLGSNKEKILLYIVAQDYSKFLQLEECIKINKFEFSTYLNDYIKIKELYEESQKIEYVTLLDELECYYEIDKEVREKYGGVSLETININKYIDDDKKNAKLKFKKLEKLNKGRI